MFREPSRFLLKKAKIVIKKIKTLLLRQRSRYHFYGEKFQSSEEGVLLSGKMSSVPKKLKKDRLLSYSNIEVIEMKDKQTISTAPFISLNVAGEGRNKELAFSAMFPSIADKMVDENQRWAIYVVLFDGTTKIRYRLKPSKAMYTIPQAFTHFQYGILYEPYQTVAGNLSVKTVICRQLENLTAYPNFLSSLHANEKGYQLEGESSKEVLDELYSLKGVGVLFKKRKGPHFKKVPIQWIDSKTWRAQVELNEFPTNNGIWDAYFYIETDNMQKKYRMKLTDKKVCTSKVLYQKDDLKGTLSFKPYKTKKSSFSINVLTETVKLYKLEVQHEKSETMKITGSFYDQTLMKKNYSFIFRERDSNIKVRVPIEITPVLNENKKRLLFKCTIDESDLFEIDQLKNSRYDIYLSGESEGVERFFRIRSGSKEMKELTRKEYHCNGELYHSYFYSTVNNRLSFVFKDPTLVRDVESMQLKNKNLTLSGYAYLEGVKNDSPEDQLISVIARSRENENERVFPTKQKYRFLRKQAHIVENGKGKWSNFHVSFSLSDLLAISEIGKDIIDLYIQVQAYGVVKERKLGTQTFVYLKDHVIDSYLLKGDDNSVGCYLTHTPRGNIKLETYHYQNSHLKQLEWANATWSLKSKKVWIVGERPDTAQDTGYHFFKYCRENYPEMEVYYAIDPSSKDIENVQPLGNVLFIGSDEHVEKCLEATAFFGSHDLEYLLPFKGVLMKSYRDGLKVFLQHGVLGRKSVEYNKHYYLYPFDLFCVSSVDEKEMVMNEMGYGEDEVIVTGLSRFDNLLRDHQPERKILLIPTWREWLNTEEDFLQSEYYNRYISLLKDENLNRLLKENNMWLEFYPHYRMQQFVGDFKDFECDTIRIVKLGEKNVQDLLKSSQIMITDYSSVSFDFTYMAKPVIYYHFDQESFFKNGILRPIHETFLGDIVHEQSEIVEAVKKYIQKGFKENEGVKYSKSQIFSQTDQHNCKRIYNVTVKYSLQDKKIETAR
ncbi:CDP-glycerol glycerophosphotransferase family protein [Alteribacter populi]|uniref:CDP-glycerol glycerophosphotransferase family protein n=1 Tax=Alteribacter populi TaxID=2011011 RepID=UPI000BBA9589|nr:CDP-glycerol glycerophosphotransferase family protein [Alteribacter populi]